MLPAQKTPHFCNGLAIYLKPGINEVQTFACGVAAGSGKPLRFLCARLIDVDGAVGCYHFFVARLCAVALPVLHSYYSAVALVPDVLEYIFIVYLAGSGLVASGNVAYLEVCYFVPRFVYIWE